MEFGLNGVPTGLAAPPAAAAIKPEEEPSTMPILPAKELPPPD